MADKNLFSGIVYKIFKWFLSVDENPSRDIGNPKSFLIVRQHNQLGDLLSGVSLFRAIKENFPGSEITLIVSPFNYPGLVKNKFIDNLFIFDKNKLADFSYLKSLIKLLKQDYDVVIVPVVVSISFTSNLISRLSHARIRIGPKSLDGVENKSAFFFDRRINIDWRKHPDSNVSERSLDIIRPFGINTTSYRSEISFDEADLKSAEEFLKTFKIDASKFIIGLHVGAGKAANRWSLDKYIELINLIKRDYPSNFYLTGSNADIEEINYVAKKLDFKIGTFLNKGIPEVAALISLSDLFISNDTGIMHVAGTTETPQVSVFGPTNPFNWAPIGSNKLFIRKSELIDDINVDEVFELCNHLLSKKKKGDMI